MALDVRRCQEVREEVHIMPEVRSFLKQAKRGTPHYRVFGPSCSGAGCSGATSTSATSVLVSTGFNRLLHQMDRSCASLRSYMTAGNQILVA